MKRSAKVELVLLLSAAASLTACNQRRCVDANNTVVPDENCAPGAPASGGGAYHWYPARSGNGAGSHAASDSAESATARGVIGAAGEAHAGGAGE